MTITYIAVAIVIILATAVAVLIDKNNSRHDTNAASIAEISKELNEKCDAIKESIAEKDRVVKVEISSLRQNANERMKNEQELSEKINEFGKIAGTAIRETRRKAAEDVDAAFTRATRYADQKADSAKKYTDD